MRLVSIISIGIFFFFAAFTPQEEEVKVRAVGGVV